uniref:non-specific serine/threonine protein kinase n=1 Tax=Solanum lycopersicum TaxID=4081 RepID=A0A3Q7FPN4_SOLLC
MEKAYSNFFISSLLLLLHLYLLETVRSDAVHTDESALLALKASFTLNSSHPLTQNWSSQSSICDWIGVTCGSRHHRVTALNISNMNILGNIAPQLGNLSFLVSLDVSQNNLHGDLPQDLSRLRRLKVMDFAFNNFSGEIPMWFGSNSSSISKLETLSVRNNRLQGNIPKEIGNLKNLKELILFGNQFTGTIPLSIFNMSSLEILGLSNNQLTGSLPVDICHRLHRIKSIGIISNHLSGHIPPGLSNCTELYELSLSYNSFNGTIPPEIVNLERLQFLNLGGNKLRGTIPANIGNLRKLQQLQLENNYMVGLVLGMELMVDIIILMGTSNLDILNHVAGLFNISTLIEVSVFFNKLSGSLPYASGYWQTNLELLNLGQNNIGGVIPTSISNSSYLQIVDLSINKFSGQIPNSLGDLRNLEYLDLFVNNLSSPHLSILTSLVNCRYLKEVILGDNPLNGVLPDTIGNLSSSIEIFDIYRTEIRGQIPLGIGNLSNLNTLFLSGNDLTGSMPTTLCDLHILQRLGLAVNRLSGSLPECLCKMSVLGLLSLYHNRISGPIPSCIGNATSLRNVYLSSNRLTNIPTSLWSLKDLLVLNLSNNTLIGSIPPELGNLKAITSINLSRNQLSGSIPSTIGDLQTLIYLSLAYNELQGSIPESLGKMISLESANLSNNILSGTIPKALELLRYLKNFNVSFNRLEGEIPSKGPFLNFTSQSFMGNGGLCGGLLFQPCVTRTFHHSRRSKLLLIILVSLGAAVMVLGSIGVFMLRRRRNRNIPNQAESFAATTLARISYIEIERATQGFDQCNLLGSGGFGSVYRAVFENGMTLAVKVFNLQVEGALKSFDAECEVLRNLRHRNLTKVISSCTNLDFKALLLEYMPNGSLELWLHSDDHFLNMIQRLDIMIDVAFALGYLHHGYETVVVHSDLKPSNVLLDEKLVGHLSDFGLAKLLGEGESIAHTKTLATMGYIAPEYGSVGLVSRRCDVYSYGIMLMETFTRKRPYDEMFQENLNMRSWVLPPFMPVVGKFG